MDEVMNEMKVAFDFLLSKKDEIKNIISQYSKLLIVMDVIENIFGEEYLRLYPDNYSIFNAINDSEFFDWCRENIEGFQGGEIEQAPQYWCGIKE